MYISFKIITILICLYSYVFSRLSLKYPPKTTIEDDCWIEPHVIMTPGRHIKKGSIIAAGSVLTKDFEEYSIVGGNPARIKKGNKL